MNRKSLKSLKLGVFLLAATVGSGWLFLRSSAANGVVYTVQPSNLNKWAFHVGKGNPVSMTSARLVNSDGDAFVHRQTTRYKNLYVGPYMLTRQNIEYSAPLFKASPPAPIDPPQAQRKLRVPTQKAIQELLGMNVHHVLQKSEQLELFSVKPHPRFGEAKPGFCDHEIVGQTVITDPKSKSELLASFYDGLVPPSNKSMMFGCFQPRHGLRAKLDGKTVDILVCFRCRQFNVYENGKEVKSYQLVTDAPQPKFNEVLAAANVAISP
ncbi:MAG: hypothetical protein EOP04_08065 [Proteobacteria bacterium]|nr:MAG: hypothetical protein EOP04_08065 [Pseudomonadota bacterium]